MQLKFERHYEKWVGKERLIFETGYVRTDRIGIIGNNI